MRLYRAPVSLSLSHVFKRCVNTCTIIFLCAIGAICYYKYTRNAKKTSTTPQLHLSARKTDGKEKQHTDLKKVDNRTYRIEAVEQDTQVLLDCKIAARSSNNDGNNGSAEATDPSSDDSCEEGHATKIETIIAECMETLVAGVVSTLEDKKTVETSQGDELEQIEPSGMTTPPHQESSSPLLVPVTPDTMFVEVNEECNHKQEYPMDAAKNGPLGFWQKQELKESLGNVKMQIEFPPNASPATLGSAQTQKMSPGREGGRQV